MDILLLMAVLPAAWLLRYVYRLDPIEKEPARLLGTLLLLGALSCVPAILLESFGMDGLMQGRQATTYAALLFENFVIIALSEELCKMVFLRWKTWRNPQFNYVFDGIVYAVFVSLGFAILENIGYVYEFGMATAVVRAVTAIPGHAIFGVFMGCFYGLEKRAAIKGQPGARAVFTVCSLLVPVVCHGFYDFCASVDRPEFFAVFLAFLLALMFVAMRLAKFMAAKAHPIDVNASADASTAAAVPSAYNPYAQSDYYEGPTPPTR